MRADSNMRAQRCSMLPVGEAGCDNDTTTSLLQLLPHVHAHVSMIMPHEAWSGPYVDT